LKKVESSGTLKKTSGRKKNMMDAWDRLREECLQCKRCALAKTRTNVVFGVGSKNAEVLFIGEAPGANEDLQGEPFVGRAGKLLDEMLEMIGLDRSKIYIANSIKCRPPQNRDPLNTEKDACGDYLKRQIELMQPKIIVCLGRISAAEIIKPDFKITQEHGQFFKKDGVEMMALYHPAALLRDPRKKPETFEDLKRLQAKIREICDHTEMKTFS
jgi:uracil-DNA glycosylase family 4